MVGTASGFSSLLSFYEVSTVPVTGRTLRGYSSGNCPRGDIRMRSLRFYNFSRDTSSSEKLLGIAEF